MRKVPPIPKELLIHSVEYREYNADNPYGEDWKPPVTLTFVRVEPNRSQQNQVPYEEIMSVVGVNLFYDCIHSLPANVKFVEKSKVIFNGREMYVNSVDELYAFGPNPHHYEVSIT